MLKNQAVCGIQKFSGNFNVVCSFLTFICAVFIRISVLFCGIRTPLTPFYCMVAKRGSQF